MAIDKGLEDELKIATEALAIQKQLNQLNDQLSKIKETLRELAQGKTKEIVVDGVGRVNISIPFAGSETDILVLDERKLIDDPELRQRLVEEGIAKQDVKRVPSCVAKVTIKPA